MEKDEIFMGKAIELSALAVEHGNEPFGAVLVRDGEIVYTNENQIHSAVRKFRICRNATDWEASCRRCVQKAAP